MFRSVSCGPASSCHWTWYFCDSSGLPPPSATSTQSFSGNWLTVKTGAALIPISYCSNTAVNVEFCCHMSSGEERVIHREYLNNLSTWTWRLIFCVQYTYCWPRLSVDMLCIEVSMLVASCVLSAYLLLRCVANWTCIGTACWIQLVWGAISGTLFELTVMPVVIA